jgi:hypothetical protein
MRAFALLPAEEQASWFHLLKSRGMMAYSINTLAEYWADGQRTGLEIIDLVEMESGIRDPELIVTFFETLERVGLVELRGEN